jgi:hypothetical protein
VKSNAGDNYLDEHRALNASIHWRLVLGIDVPQAISQDAYKLPPIFLPKGSQGRLPQWALQWREIDTKVV